MRIGGGLNGSFPIWTRSATAIPFTSSGTCVGTLYAPVGGTDLYRIDLTGYPIGGTLTISNCANDAFPTLGASSGDTMIYAFTNCPSGGDVANWGCIQYNDDSCGLNSQVSFTTTTSVVYAMVNAYTTSSWVSGFWWTYV